MIQCRALTKSFGRHMAVNNLSFEAAPGRVTGFLGRNGAGKTHHAAGTARTGPGHLWVRTDRRSGVRRPPRSDRHSGRRP